MPPLNMPNEYAAYITDLMKHTGAAKKFNFKYFIDLGLYKGWDVWCNDCVVANPHFMKKNYLWDLSWHTPEDQFPKQIYNLELAMEQEWQKNDGCIWEDFIKVFAAQTCNKIYIFQISGSATVNTYINDMSSFIKNRSYKLATPEDYLILIFNSKNSYVNGSHIDCNGKVVNLGSSRLPPSVTI